jgi:endonuclease/exonuclease/phosphatase family metal-dependent hydrolase
VNRFRRLTEHSSTVRVITYNLHKGRGRRRRSILEEAARALADREPDLLLCQEVYHAATSALHQCHFLTEVIGHPFVFGPNSFYRNGCHGNATFARMPVARHTNVDLTESRLERRGMLRTWLLDGPADFEVFNVHFSLTAGQRRRQWARLLAELPEDPTVRVLACGDFNDWSSSIDRLARRSQVLRNALWDLPWAERATFPAQRAMFGLDRIYYRGFRLQKVRVLRGPPWSELSDHLPVEADLQPI